MNSNYKTINLRNNIIKEARVYTIILYNFDGYYFNVSPMKVSNSEHDVLF